MATAILRKRLSRMQADLTALRHRETPAPVLEQIRADPALIFRASGLTPDPWQERILKSQSDRLLLLCSRQAGKSTVAGAVALAEALLRPKSLVLLLSP